MLQMSCNLLIRREVAILLNRLDKSALLDGQTKLAKLSHSSICSLITMKLLAKLASGSS